MWGAIRLVGDLLFLGSAMGTVVFVALYGLRSRWRATPAGRVTLALMATISMIMTSAIVFGLWWPDDYEHARLVVRVMLYGLLFSAIVSYIFILGRAQRRDKTWK